MEVKPNWWIALRVWWAYTWRLLLFTFVAGLPFTLLVKQFGGRSELVDNLIFLTSSLVFILVEVAVMGRLLRRDFGSFRIAIVKKTPGHQDSL
jgi:hypothetical protein